MMTDLQAIMPILIVALTAIVTMVAESFQPKGERVPLGGLGLIGNIVVGIVGGFIGYWLLPKLGLHIKTGTGWLDYVLTAGIGAVVLLALVNIIFGGRR